MSIDTNAAINVFGTQQTTSDTTANVSTSGFSVSGDTTTFTNSDDTSEASFVAALNYSVAPTAGGSVNVYSRLMNIDSTNDQPEPSTTFKYGFLGSFIVANATGNQYIPLDIVLPNTYTGQVYEFYIENLADQTLQSGWTLKITPKTLAPKA